MESLEISARTVEEAIQRALGQLGVSRDEVNITVLKEGKTGILGLGSEEALVRVEVKAEVKAEEDKGNKDETFVAARGIIEKLVSLLGMEATVSPQPQSFVDEAEVPPVGFDIQGEDLGILIGRHGQTITSLQYIVRLILSHRTRSQAPVVIDVNGYKQRRYEALKALALRMAEQVVVRKVPFTLEPMPAFERRIIHLSLANNPNVTTQSIGEGEARKVVILLKEH